MIYSAFALAVLRAENSITKRINSALSARIMWIVITDRVIVEISNFLWPFEIFLFFIFCFIFYLYFSMK